MCPGRADRRRPRGQPPTGARGGPRGARGWRTDRRPARAGHVRLRLRVREEARSCAEPADGPIPPQLVGGGGGRQTRSSSAASASLAQTGPSTTRRRSSTEQASSPCTARSTSGTSEQIFFEAGSEPAPVVETAVARIGVGVCYDLEFPGARARPRPRRRRPGGAARELSLASPPGGRAADRGHQRHGHGVPEPHVRRGLRPHRSRARRRVGGRERRLRRARLAARRSARRASALGWSSPTATFPTPARRPGTSATTSSATAAPSSTGWTNARPPPERRASPRESPPPGPAGRDSRPPRAPRSPHPPAPLTSARSGTRPSARTSKIRAELGLELRGEQVADRDAAPLGAGELEVVLEPYAGAVEASRVQVPLVLVERLGDGRRADGDRDVVPGRVEEIGAREAGRVSAPVGDDHAPAAGPRAAEHVPGLDDLDSRRAGGRARTAPPRWRRRPRRARARRPSRSRPPSRGAPRLRRPRAAACSCERASARARRASAPPLPARLGRRACRCARAARPRDPRRPPRRPRRGPPARRPR